MSRTTTTTTVAVVALVLAAALSGCNSENSAPKDASAPAEAPGAAASATPAQALPVDDNNSPSQVQGGWRANGVDGLQCQLDTISGQAAKTGQKIRREAGISLEGWAFENGQAPVEKLALILVKGEEAYAARAKGGIARPDVAEAFKLPALANTGFTTMMDLSAVPAGTYALWISNGTSASDKACNLKIDIDLQG